MAQYHHNTGGIHIIPSVLNMYYEQEKVHLENEEVKLPKPESVTVCVDQEEFVEYSESDFLPIQEELPRPETITVCVDQEEFVDYSDLDNLSVQSVNPLDVDPLSLEQQPILPTIKRELDGEVHLQKKQSSLSGQPYVSDENDDVQYICHVNTLTANNMSSSNSRRESVIVPIASENPNNAKLKILNVEEAGSSVEEAAGSSVEEVNTTQVTECVKVSEESQKVQDCTISDVSKRGKQKNTESKTSDTDLVHYKVAVPKSNSEGKLIVLLKRSKVAERLLCETGSLFDTVKEDTDDGHNLRSDYENDTVNEHSILEQSGEQGEKAIGNIMTTENESIDSDMHAKKMKELEPLSLNAVSQTSDVNTSSGEAFKTAARCIDCHKIFQTVGSWRGHRPGCHERKRKALLVHVPQIQKRRCSARGNLFNKRSGMGIYNAYGKYTCQLCKRGFSSNLKLKKHFCIVMEKNPFQCKKCKRIFSSTIALKIHGSKVHKQSKTEVFKSAEHTEQNVNVEKYLFPCESCNKTFSTSSALNVHKISHNEPVHEMEELSLMSNSFRQGDMCSKQYSVKYNLQDDVSSKMTTQQNTEIQSMFNCNICNEIFSTYQELNNHGIVHATQVLQPYLQNTVKFFRRGKGWGCPICPKTRSTKGALKYHMRLHLNSELFECHVCKKSFSDLYNLQRHKKTHSKEQTYPCNICGVIYYSAYQLRLHKCIHKQNERHFPCSFCRKFFSSHQHLSEHECSAKQGLASSNVDKTIQSANSWKTRNTKSKNSSREIITDPKYTLKRKWTCSVCEKTVTSKHSLIMHMYLHTEKPHQCDICKKRFTTFFWLSNHISTRHNAKRPYQCDSCDKTYCRPDSLRVHRMFCAQRLTKVDKPQELKLPSNKKEYYCERCNSSFSTSGYLKRHTNLYHRTISKFLFHSDGRIFQCDICSKTCLTLNNMKQHISNFHKFQAKNEGKEISESKFQSKKRYKCDYCNSTFGTSSALGAHVRRFHEIQKNFQITEKNLAHTVRNNSVGKRYKCHPCNVTFISKSYLQSHINVVHRRKDITSLANSKSSKKVRRCDHCGIACRSLSNLLNHIRLIHGNKENHLNAKKSLAPSITFNSIEIHKCDKCEGTFHDIHKLTRHIKSAHCQKLKRNNSVVVKSNEKTYKCKICGTMFLQKGKFLKHNCHSNVQNKSSPALIFKSKLSSKYNSDCKKRCLVCGESFILLDELKDHMLLHTAQERSYNCRVCHLTFSSSQALAGHSRGHKGIKDYVDVSSPQITSLKPKNNSRRQFKCELCERILSTRNALARHNMIHTGERPFSCSICGSDFRERYKLVQHMTSHEILLPEVVPYKCNVCGRSFMKMCNLARHQVVHNKL